MLCEDVSYAFRVRLIVDDLRNNNYLYVKMFNGPIAVILFVSAALDTDRIMFSLPAPLQPRPITLK
jgi:hypothetical protein